MPEHHRNDIINVCKANRLNVEFLEEVICPPSKDIILKNFVV